MDKHNLQDKIKNIMSWMQYWRENAIYGILSREVYKISGRSRNTSVKVDKDARIIREHMERLNNMNFNQFWGNSSFLDSFRSHVLMEHFSLMHYDNPLGNKINEIIGSFSQASYTPKLDEDNEVQFPEFASLLRQRLEKFFKQEDIRATLTSLIDNLMCSGYGVIKMNYKRKNLSSELIKEYQICLDPVFYPEMAFFSPFAKTATKTDDFYSLPNNFCGIIHKVDRELIKEKYKKQLKGNYPQSIGVMQEQAPFLHALMTDNRNLVFIAEYFNYTKEGKVERTLFCQNCVLEHTIYNWDFLPIIYVDGNSSYVSDIQQVYSLFDKALNVQKRMNFTTSRIIELTPFAKTSTFAFINKFTLDEQFITDVHDVSNSNYIIMQQAPHGLTEQDPPILLPAVELPQTLLASREQDIMFLDQMMRGYYDSNDSRFGESGRALELKQQSKSNLFAIQLGNLSNGLKKFSEFYIKMFYGVHRNNITDQSYELLQSFDTFESYCIATDSISFDIIVDPNVSLTKEVNRRALAEAMQYIPEPMIREILIKDYVRNMPVSDPSSLLREITQAMIKQQEMQEKQANEPTELEKIQTLQNQSNEKIAEQRNQVTLEQHREDNLTKLVVEAMKQESEDENRLLKELEIKQKTDIIKSKSKKDE